MRRGQTQAEMRLVEVCLFIRNLLLRGVFDIPRKKVGRGPDSLAAHALVHPERLESVADRQTIARSGPAEWVIPFRYRSAAASSSMSFKFAVDPSNKGEPTLLPLSF